MKIKSTLSFVVAFLLMGFLTEASAQDYYWSSNRKILLQKDKEVILVKAGENSSTERKLTQGKTIKALERVNRHSVLVRLSANDPSSLTEMTSISGNYTFSFKSSSGDKMIPTGEILFKPKKGIGIDKINQLVGEKLKVIKVKYGCYKVLIEDYSTLLKVANQLYESGLVEYSHPNFIMEITKHQNDPLYPDQYYLNNTGQFGGTAGIDINAPQAWSISTGIHTIRVAVIDDGVENHVDINGRVLQGFTPRDANGLGAPVNGSAHGQACAGIIAASRSNNEGIAGIAPCTDIVPVNIFNGGETTGDLADAIDWAWDEGQADVLSNSWGFNSSTAYFDNIVQAIGRARTQGRGGDGAIVVFASGNSHGAFSGVTFPASAPGVVTVGAVDRSGNIWGYSSRGSQMDLVAPSGNTNLNGDVRTTDRPGTNGYANGNYTTEFGGTSAACPQVAGVAALMLSVNPELTEAQVVSILRNTATNMGPSGFDNTYGYGRVNARLAVSSAVPKITGPSSICTSGSMSVVVPAGTSVSWSVNPSNALNFSQGGATTSFSRNGSYSGGATITATLNGGCGSKSISKSIGVGNLLPLDLRLRDSNTNNPVYFICRDQPTNVKAKHDSSAPVSSWQWNVSGAHITYNPSSSDNSLVTLRPYSNNVTVKIRAQNGCGWSEWSDVSPDIIPCGMFFTVYPNPSDTELFLLKNNAEAFLEKDFERSNVNGDLGPITLELYDFSGNRVRQYVFGLKDSSPKIDVSGFKKGLYILKIISKNVNETHQIVIE
ncbi:S8/S53 family peptidase [Rapidithrix thailandica]|uniref:S8/S53 family peptidase n=1 Tax=Rapidithrix thailandica TaxID=413964 RepID=A0AAW9S2X1_9BACT